MSSFNMLKNRVILSSLAGSGIGVFLWFTPAKPLSTWLVAASCGAIASSEAIIGGTERTYKKQFNLIELEARKLSDELANERRITDSKVQEIESQAITLNKFKQESAQLLAWVNKLREELTDKSNQIESLKTANGELSTEVLMDSFEEFKTQLNTLTNSLSKRYPDLQKDWESLSYEIENYIKLFATKVSVVMAQKSATELIEMSLAMQHEVISTGATLKIKAYKSVVTYLQEQILNVIPLVDHEQAIKQMLDYWQTKNQAVANEYQGNLESVRQEFSQVADSVITGYREDFKGVIDEGMSQAEQIEALQIEILNLQRQLEQASKPHRFPAAVEQSRVGNAIIDYYYRTGIVLDAIDWQDTETGYTLLFHIGRNGDRFISSDILNANDAPQKLKEVSAAINTPELKSNARGGHMALEVQTRRAPKKPVDVSKLAKSADSFLSVVSRWRRVRITGGSDAGKSPTAENLAVCILKTINGQWVMKFYDPMHDSSKNYRSIPACGTSHQDSANGLREMEGELTARSQGANRDIFYLAWFDEVDTTLNKHDVGGDLLNIIKQASHQNMAIIVTGQNANTRKFKGFDKSDFNNMVSVHIGDDYLNVLANRLCDHPEKVELLERGNKLTQWCDEQNQEHGLSRTDPEAFRFALVVEPAKKPFFVFLPDFGCYTFDQVNPMGLLMVSSPSTFQTNPTPNSELLLNQSSKDVRIPRETAICPHCQTPTDKVKERKPSANRYSCLNPKCAKSFTQRIANN